MPLINITVDINKNIFLRDPLETSLGKKIIEHSIILMNEIGFEEFNFKKLANEMNSTEASIYRYFENKYRLLSYLVSWYWDLMHFMVLLDIRNLKDSKEKLTTAINTLVYALDDNNTPDYLDQAKLHMLVVENATKVYHNKKVDDLNKIGFYANYKKLVKTLSNIILEIDSKFKYPVSIATNIIEMSLNNEYYISHLPGLTDKSMQPKNAKEETINMINYVVERLLK